MLSTAKHLSSLFRNFGRIEILRSAQDHNHSIALCAGTFRLLGGMPRLRSG